MRCEYRRSIHFLVKIISVLPVLITLSITLSLFTTTSFANQAALFEHSNPQSWMIGAYLSMKGEVLPLESWPLPVGFLEKHIPIENNVRSLSHADGKSSADTSFFMSVSPEISINNWHYHPKSRLVDLVQAYRYDSMKPWMVFGFQTSISDDLYFLIHMDMRKEIANFFEKDDHDNLPFTGLDFSLSPSSEAFDFNFPTKGYTSYYSKNFFFNMGRSQLAWGPMTHGLTLSDNSPYYDEASFAYTTQANFIKRFSFTYNAISVDPSLTPAEYKIQSGSPDPMAGGFVYNERAKFLFAHRIDFLITRNFRIGLGELKLLGGKFPDFQDCNPFIIWHNTYGEGYSNSFGTLDFSYVPIKSLELYGEFALDQDQNPVTQQPTPGHVPVGYKPVAYGYGVGGKYSWGRWNDISQLGVEYYYVLPWMYNRWQPYLKFTNRMMRVSNDPGSRFFTDYPFGYIYGPDSQSLNIFFKTHRYGIDLNGGFLWLKKGSISTLTSYNSNEYYLTTPSGTVEDTKALYLNVSVPLNQNFSVFGSADLRYVTNFRNQDTLNDNPILGNLWLYDFRIGIEYAI